MYLKKKILAVIPARGGSTEVKKKNLRRINGKSLVEIVCNLAKQINYLDEIVLSTDDREIQKIGKKFKIIYEDLRPKKLSTNNAAAIDVWRYEWLRCEKKTNQIFDYSIYIEPTSPLRKKKHLQETIKKIVKNKYSAVWTVSKTDPRNHPFKKLRINNSGLVNYYDLKGKKIVARQQLDELYERNGLCYAASRDTVIKKKSLSGNKCFGLVCKGNFVSIDSQFDLKLARILSNEKKN